MHYTFKPKGICAQVIEFDIEEKKLSNLKIYGGCDGNHKGLAALVEGADAEDVVKRLSGIHCGPRPTSCPDQVAQAVKKALEGEKCF